MIFTVILLLVFLSKPKLYQSDRYRLSRTALQLPIAIRNNTFEHYLHRAPFSYTALHIIMSCKRNPVFPSLVPLHSVQSTWFSTVGEDNEEENLAKTEGAFEQFIASIRDVQAPNIIGFTEEENQEDDDDERNEVEESVDEREEEEEEEEEEEPQFIGEPLEHVTDTLYV